MRKNFLFLCVLLIVLGCGENAGNFMKSDAGYPSKELQTKFAPADTSVFAKTSDLDGVAMSGEEVSKLPEQTADPNRRIIYTANLSIIVEDFESVPDKVIGFVQSHGGYVSETRVGQLEGTSRSGTWKIRIPVDRYRDFLRSASGLGVPTSLTENAMDVSEEFFDLEARISSGKKLEEQVMKLLDRQTEKIEDLVAIERELARIRLDIERMEGRMRFLANQVAMSTVNLNVSEQRTFVPASQPALGRRVSVEWTETLGRTGRFFENLLVGLVANFFAIIASIVAALFAWIAARFIWRRARARIPQTQTANQ